MCPLHTFTVYEGRETDGCSEEIRWRRQGREWILKHPALTRGCPGQHRPEDRGGGGGGGSVIDVPCDWSLRHAHMEMTPRPGWRSR